MSATRPARWLIPSILALLASMTSAAEAPEAVSFYAPFDGSDAPAVAPAGTMAASEGAPLCVPGLLGQAVLIGTQGTKVAFDCPEAPISPDAGTIAFWIKPLGWNSDDETTGTPRVLFKIWGEPSAYFLVYHYFGPQLLFLTQTNNFAQQAGVNSYPGWKSGEWHHVACTWCAEGLAIYLDGVLANRAPDVVHPKRFANTFSVGPDDGWGAQTEPWAAVDEFRLYRRALKAWEIHNLVAAAPGSKLTPMQPSMELAVEPSASRYEIVVRADVSAIPGSTGATMSASLLGPHGKALDRTEGHPARDGRWESALSTIEVPPGIYAVEVVAREGDGRELVRQSRPLRVEHTPPWHGWRYRAEGDTVPPPWTPISVQGGPGRGRVIGSCWGRSYTFGASACMDRATTQGFPLLAGPISLIARYDGRDHPVTIRANTEVSARPDALVLDSDAVAGPKLRCSVVRSLQYDGLVLISFELRPAEPVKLESLTLQWNMPPTAALSYAGAGRGADSYAPLRAPHTEWPFRPWFWLGNEQGGLCWFAETNARWSPRDPARTIAIDRATGAVRVAVSIVGKPKLLEWPIGYDFGFLATPVKPLPKDWHLLNVTSDVWGQPHPASLKHAFVYPDWIWRNLPDPFDTHMKLPPQFDFKAHVQGLHDRNILYMPWIFLNAQQYDPRYDWFFPDWWRRPVTGRTDAGLVGVCTRSDWGDALFWAIEKWALKYGIDGVYFDVGDCPPCNSPDHGCGEQLGDGSWVATYPILAQRELKKKLYTRLYEQTGKQFVFMSLYNGDLNLPAMTFDVAEMGGEEWSGINADDFGRTVPLARFHGEVNADRYGILAIKLHPWLDRPHNPAAEDQPITYHLLEGAPMWGFPGHALPAIKALEQAGADGSGRWLPYWAAGDAVTTGEEQVKASLWVKPDRALLILGSLQDADAVCRAIVKPESLGWKPAAPLSASDAISGEALSVDGQAIAVTVPGRLYRMVWVSPAG